MGRNGADASARMEWGLKEVGLWDEVKDRLDRPAETLSGGQKQRLCLARALILEPSVLLLDEPSGSLDFRATERIETLLQSLKRRYTIVAVSHSLSQVRRLADRLYILREGRKVGIFLREQLQDRTVFENLLEEFF
jgi:phosphate transport system ATP-binding protein